MMCDDARQFCRFCLETVATGDEQRSSQRHSSQEWSDLDRQVLSLYDLPGTLRYLLEPVSFEWYHSFLRGEACMECDKTTQCINADLDLSPLTLKRSPSS